MANNQLSTFDHAKLQKLKTELWQMTVSVNQTISAVMFFHCEF